MSHNYSASQFDEPFKPIRLNVYTPFTSMPISPHGVHAMCLPTHCSPTKIIADDNGKMFCEISRGASSPWGDYATSIWEKTCDCCCIPQTRHPQKYCCTPQKHIFVTAARRRKVKPPPCICAPDTGLERMRQARADKKQNRDRKKAAQLLKKEEIDMKLYLKKQETIERSLRPVKVVDWNVLRKTGVPGAGGSAMRRKKNKAPKGPVCPPLGCCCKKHGEPVVCCSLRDDMYI